MKKYTTPNILLLCLFFVSLLFAACKDKGNEEVKQPTATTTAVEGAWKLGPVTDPNTGAIETMIITFIGTNYSMASSEQNAIQTSGITGTVTEVITITGTFRLNNNQILITPTAATLATTTNVTADSTGTYSPIPYTNTNSGTYSSSSLQMNQESPLGNYTIMNGTTLRISDPSDPSNYMDFVKL
ncbi:MAG: hypothetical protein J6T84_04200 [Spirochaetaceae bacterium]|nr:hypothetical protein [Spirochaetaceae bacterium]